MAGGAPARSSATVIPVRQAVRRVDNLFGQAMPVMPQPSAADGLLSLANGHRPGVLLVERSSTLLGAHPGAGETDPEGRGERTATFLPQCTMYSSEECIAHRNPLISADFLVTLVYCTHAE